MVQKIVFNLAQNNHSQVAYVGVQDFTFKTHQKKANIISLSILHLMSKKQYQIEQTSIYKEHSSTFYS